LQKVAVARAVSIHQVVILPKVIPPEVQQRAIYTQVRHRENLTRLLSSIKDQLTPQGLLV
jgi:hypothetical protein